MTSDDSYFIQLDSLVRAIYDKSVLKKPHIGEIPDFSRNDFDPIIAKALALTKEVEINNNINQILRSQEGVVMFEKEVSLIDSLLKRKVELYNDATSIKFKYETDNYRSFLLKSHGYSVSFYWKEVYWNTSEEAYLLVKFWDGSINFNNDNYYFPGDEPKILQEMKYFFDMDYQMNALWRFEKEKVKSEDLIQSAFSFIINRIQEEKSKNFRR